MTNDQTAKNIAEQAINRAKSLKLYEVEYTLPEDFSFPGTKVPFDLFINGYDVVCKVYANSYDDAHRQVEDFFLPDAMDS